MNERENGRRTMMAGMGSRPPPYRSRGLPGPAAGRAAALALGRRWRRRRGGARRSALPSGGPGSSGRPKSWTRRSLTSPRSKPLTITSAARSLAERTPVRAVAPRPHAHEDQIAQVDQRAPALKVSRAQDLLERVRRAVAPDGEVARPGDRERRLQIGSAKTHGWLPWRIVSTTFLQVCGINSLCQRFFALFPGSAISLKALVAGGYGVFRHRSRLLNLFL